MHVSVANARLAAEEPASESGSKVKVAEDIVADSKLRYALTPLLK